MNNLKIIETDINNIKEYGVCGYKNPDKPGYLEKLNWLRTQYQFDLKIKILYSHENGTQGMIEYLPGDLCWRPVNAKDFLFIHCLFVGFRRKYKNRGYGTKLIKNCLDEASKEDYKGVAAVTRKGAFMAGKDIFIKNGFEIVDQAKPDFQLLVKKFNGKDKNPYFYHNWNEKLKKYQSGLFILRSDQCPYSVKNVNEIIAIAKNKFNIQPNLVNLQNYKQAQKSPLPFGTFGIIYNGEILAHHPISSKRFSNIMSSLPNQ